MRSEKDKDDPYGVLGPGSGGPVSTLDFERSLLSPLLSPLSLERVLLVRRPMGARGPAPWCSTSANRRRRGRRFHERVMWREREGGRERLATGVVALAQSQKPRKGAKGRLLAACAVLVERHSCQLGMRNLHPNPPQDIPSQIILRQFCLSPTMHGTTFETDKHCTDGCRLRSHLRATS